MEEIEKPTLIDKIKTYLYFKKIHQKNYFGKYYKISRYSNDEIKEKFKKYENEFNEYIEELKFLSKEFIEHLNK